MRKLDCYFLPKINKPFERHVFRGLYQEEGRNSGPISKRLRQLLLAADDEKIKTDSKFLDDLKMVLENRKTTTLLSFRIQCLPSS